MESVIVKTGILKLADRGTKTNKPFNKKEKNSSSVKASSKNTKGGKVGKGGHTGPRTDTFAVWNSIARPSQKGTCQEGAQVRGQVARKVQQQIIKTKLEVVPRFQSPR